MRIRTNGLFKKKNIYTIERYTFFLLILSMPFTDFLIEFPFISHYLPRLFILLGLGIILFERIQYGIRFSKIEKILLMLMGITFIWYIISNLHGFLFYPFFYPSHWDDFKEILFLKKYFFDFFLENNILATKIAAVFYFIRMSFFECLYTMGAAFFAIHLYQENPKSGFNDFQKYIVILAVIIILYSLIELPALMGSTLCKSILAFINYHTMSINHVGGGWPPVFWPMQVRSIFAEPSFFGLGFAVIFPILLHWSTFYDKEKKWMYLRIVIVVMYVLLAFATRSRTTTVLILAETALFAFGFLWIRVLDFKKLLKIIIPVALAFLLSLPLLSTFSGTWYDRTTQEKSITSMADTYVEDNITSVINSSEGGQKRSNSIRTTLNKAYFRVGLDHPMFGVGFGMTAYYVDEHISEADAANNELETDSKNLHEQGERKAGYPILNYFAYQFATYGFIGLMIYILPVLYIMFHTFKRIKKLSADEITLLVALMGVLASCFSNAPLVSIYIVIGLLICFVSPYCSCINKR